MSVVTLIATRHPAGGEGEGTGEGTGDGLLRGEGERKGDGEGMGDGERVGEGCGTGDGLRCGEGEAEGEGDVEWDGGSGGFAGDLRGVGFGGGCGGCGYWGGLGGGGLYLTGGAGGTGHERLEGQHVFIFPNMDTMHCAPLRQNVGIVLQGFPIVMQTGRPGKTSEESSQNVVTKNGSSMQMNSVKPYTHPLLGL